MNLERKELAYILHGRKCVTRIIPNCVAAVVSDPAQLIPPGIVWHWWSTHRSPHTLCRFRLGLRPGVLSLCRLELSTSFSLLDNASASIASDTSRIEGDPISTLASDRLVGTVGGVFDRGGVSRCGVSGRSEVVAMAIGFSMRPLVFMPTSSEGSHGDAETFWRPRWFLVSSQYGRIMGCNRRFELLS
jgi:hypothetical protein